MEETNYHIILHKENSFMRSMQGIHPALSMLTTNCLGFQGDVYIVSPQLFSAPINYPVNNYYRRLPLFLEKVGKEPQFT
jgi:hypothetical protein